jgi:hypothetical protein
MPELRKCYQCDGLFNPAIVDYISTHVWLPHIWSPVKLDVVVEATCYEAFKRAQKR